MKEKNILITGGGGIFGKILISRIEELGCNLTILENKNNKKSKKSVECDIRNFDQINKIIIKYKPKIIIHLAGITGNAECETKVNEALMTNVMGTHNILKSNIKNKSKIIFASSREVYEETEKSLSEVSTLNPKNINGITKMFSEKLIQNFNQKYDIPFMILRFSNFIGEENEKRGISVMIKNAIQKNKITMYGGEQEIDLLHYNDAVNSILKSIVLILFDVFFGSGNSIKIIELVKKLEKKINKEIKITKKPIRDFESMYCKLDTSKARKNLKFIASENIDTILSKMISRWN